MQNPTFDFITYIERNDREYDVEVTYSFNGDEVVLKNWALKASSYDMTDYELDAIHNEACERADADYAEWQADYGDYLHELAQDRELFA